MTNPKNNGKGIAGNTTQQNNGKAVINTNATTTAPKAEETPKAEEKAADVPQEKTLHEQMKHFEGLEKLVTIRRKFEGHLEAVKALEVDDEDLAKFETGNNYGVRIELHDSKRREYSITNPRLVKEMQAHLMGLLNGKIAEYDNKILEYGK